MPHSKPLYSDILLTVKLSLVANGVTELRGLPLSTAVSSEAWAKLRDWASVGGRGRLLLSGSVAHASLETTVAGRATERGNEMRPFLQRASRAAKKNCCSYRPTKLELGTLFSSPPLQHFMHPSFSATRWATYLMKCKL